MSPSPDLVQGNACAVTNATCRLGTSESRVPLGVVFHLDQSGDSTRQEPTENVVRAGSVHVRLPEVGHPPQTKKVEAHELWSYLPSSPPSPTADAFVETPSPYSGFDEIGDVFGMLGDNVLGEASDVKSKRSLDWACTHIAKRRRLHREPFDTRSNRFHAHAGDLTQEESTMKSQSCQYGHREQGNTSQQYPFGTQDDSGAKDTRARLENSFWPSSHVPPECRDLFPPDMVLGASLLLDLKYSSNTLSERPAYWS